VASAAAPQLPPAQPATLPAPKPASSVRDVAPAVATSPAAEPFSMKSGVNLGVGWLAEVGLLPGFSSGPRLAFGASSRGWSLELAVAWLLERRAERPALGTARADIRWFGGQISMCRALVAVVRACAGGELGELVGEASGVERPLTASGLWV